ncbi:MAG TPA: DoxX family protein [Brevundimonas sp.]|jgi:hypothetical protein|uniref:DoxX family protein n=1 Tax=Brevundimonas sp. TaxID=1871086 RepID=UPI002E140151|nr:DoxX family protein [Brevundimonas sp.]
MTTLNAASRPLGPRERLRATRRNLLLWTFQGWLAMFFVAAGYAKLTEPLDHLALLFSWSGAASSGFVRGVGLVEVVAGLALLAPLASWRLGRPPLLGAAALLAAMALIMAVVHGLQLEAGAVLLNVVLFTLAATVVRGRSR